MEVICNIIPFIGSFLVPLWGDLMYKNVITSNFSGKTYRMKQCYTGYVYFCKLWTSELKNDAHSNNK